MMQIARMLRPEQVLYEESSVAVDDEDSEKTMRKSTILGYLVSR
jgi:hypothetical protein